MVRCTTQYCADRFVVKDSAYQLSSEIEFSIIPVPIPDPVPDPHPYHYPVSLCCAYGLSLSLEENNADHRLGRTQL